MKKKVKKVKQRITIGRNTGQIVMRDRRKRRQKDRLKREISRELDFLEMIRLIGWAATNVF